MTPLKPRELDVLITIVEDYISTALPVGSRTVAKKSSLRLSPASMRNTMADLTDKGYLHQPHTSAGRIPTVEAFRFYLDTTLRLNPLSEDKKRSITLGMQSTDQDMTSILRKAGSLLSGLSHQVSMVLAPSREEVRWREIGLALIRPRLILVVLVMDGGMVHNRVIEIDEEVSADELASFANYLNEHFRGRPLVEARRFIRDSLLAGKRRLQKMYLRALTLAEQIFAQQAERDVFVDGAENMFDYVEFSDKARMREIMHFLNERSKMLEILDKSIEAEELRITLAQETDLSELGECSLVAAPYSHEGRPLGVVSVIGPQRMDYASVVPLVDHMSRVLTSLLKDRFWSTFS